MFRISRNTWAVVAVAVAGFVGLQAPAPAASEAQSATLDRTLLDRYCVTCHNERLQIADLMLDRIDLAQTGAHAEVLEKVVRKLRSGEMPPMGRPRPDKATVHAFATSLEEALDRAAEARPNPGRVALHRLNRTEYVNAIRDLLALEIDGAALLPSDLSGLGFDNNADVLSITPALMARYMSAATKISRLAVGSESIRPIIQVYQAPEFGRQDARMGDRLPFGTYGGLAVRHAFPLDGEYGFKIRLQRNRVGNTIRGLDDQREIEVRLDHGLLRRFTIGGEYKGTDPGILIAIAEDEVEEQRLHTYRLTADDHLEFRMPVKAGTRLVSVAFADVAASVSESVPLSPRSIKASVFTDDAGNPGIDTIAISGPFEGTTPEDTASRRKIFICTPASVADEEPCARQIISALARRAFRRAVTDADVDRLVAMYRQGRAQGNFDAGLERALEALLVSPKFLMRLEAVPLDTEPGTIYRISDAELASRLSFFLWSSIPDDELLAVAERGTLSDPAVLEQQVQRMRADPKAAAFMKNFASQWLITRNLELAEPDPNRFPDFDDTLRDGMLRETELFIASQVRDDRSVVDLLRADYTYMNERLAEHYGIPNIYGSHFRRVQVEDETRRGLLGHASVLLVTSYAHRTSVVLRGKWVLETLLGAPPPLPPPDVPPLEEQDPRGGAPTSLREKMEQHRANPVCASCHSQMDPMGFALENFDATGQWRDDDGGAEIDPVVTTPDGTHIDGPRGFREVLVARSDEYVRTVTEKLFTYALGRGVEYYDMPTIRRLVRETAPDHRWSALVLGIVRSEPFQMRKVSESDAPVGAAN